MNPTARDYLPLAIAAIGLAALPSLMHAIGLGTTSATEVVVFAIACMALNILVGTTGLVSFGHGAWFGLAAYAAGLIQRNWLPGQFALPILLKLSGKSLSEILDDLSERSGLLGLSGVSPDMRDVEEAAAKGNELAELALNVFAASIRQYLSSYLVVLNGADAIVFTGGIGENSTRIRKQVCENLDFAGIELDLVKNESAKGEVCLSTPKSRTQIWVVPTNEEIVVARQSLAAVTSQN